MAWFRVQKILFYDWSGFYNSLYIPIPILISILKVTPNFSKSISLLLLYRKFKFGFTYIPSPWKCSLLNTETTHPAKMFSMFAGTQIFKSDFEYLFFDLVCETFWSVVKNLPNSNREQSDISWTKIKWKIKAYAAIFLHPVPSSLCIHSVKVLICLSAKTPDSPAAKL